MIVFALPRQLQGASAYHPLTHAVRRFAALGGAQLCRAHSLHRYMQVDAIQQRPGNFAGIAVNLFSGAATATVVAAVVTAGAGIHGGQQLKASRVASLRSSAGNSNLTTFQRLAQYFQYLTLKLRQLI